MRVSGGIDDTIIMMDYLLLKVRLAAVNKATHLHLHDYNKPIGMTKQLSVLLISITAAMGGLLFGFDFAIFSGTIPFIRPAFNLDSNLLGWTSSSIYIGCIIGTLITGFITDRFGRRLPLIAAALLFAASALLMGWANSYTSLILWRVVAGIAVGAASMLSPLYIAEISPAPMRGMLVAVNQLTIVIGILLAYLSSYWLAGVENNWRWMFSSAAIPAGIFFLSALALPESPRWLVMKGKTTNAVKVFKQLDHPGDITEEIKNIRLSGADKSNGNVSALFNPRLSLIIFIGITIAIFQQISGANVVFVYAPLIFEKAGMDVRNQLFQQILIGSINLLFTLIAMRIIDRAGRRNLMILGAIGMSLMLALIGAAFYFNWLNGPWVTILTLIFIAIYATTLAPVTWVLISEIFPNRIRGIAVSAATTLLWMACFGVTYVFPVLVNYFREQIHITFLIFSGICFVYFLFLLKFIPETRNKSLEQIEAELTGLRKN